ncbi:Histone acetyltransferase [Sporothrix epigloea]|uniref:Histone acetyltransferase n=1 Tax=Sporothrix epigloea TaxID=1892477 RepID=A0ABP0D9P2_9PEZI
MASAQLIQEERQNRAAVCQPESSSQIGGTHGARIRDRTVRLGKTGDGRSSAKAGDDEQHTGESGGEDEDDDKEDSDYGHGDGDDYESGSAEGDAVESEDDAVPQSSIATRQFRSERREPDSSHDEEDNDSIQDDNDEDEDAVEDEGVGAVKIRPGETDDDSEASAVASDSSDEEWEEEAQSSEDSDEADEEEEEEEMKNDDEEDEEDQAQETSEASHDKKEKENDEAHVECSSKYENGAGASDITGSVDSGMSLRKRRKNAADGLHVDGLSGTRNIGAPNSVRVLRIKPPEPSHVSIVKKAEDSLILKIKVAPADLRRITVKKRKYTKRGTAPPRISKKEKKRLLELAAENGLSIGSSALPLMPSTTVYTQPFYSFFDKETDELNGKPYGGILTEAETDTSKTFPTADDRSRFDDAKQRAEEEWRARLLAAQAEAEAQPVRKKKALGPASQIECIEFGGWEIDTWYAAPYPEEYSRNRVLYICEFCLKYMNSDYVAWRHKLKCPAKHPPGDEIYRHESISFFEVDGRKNPVYCQNLCLLAKLFLGSKTLYYDVEPFLFYVLCEYDEFGYHFVGYFSKEKRASSQNNVSCILTLPIHQRKGYGNLLIDFSYLLTRVEEKTGSPEKPLSDMGLVSYRNYWRLVMCRYLLDAMTESKDAKLGLSIKQISDDTGMTADDVISALEGLRCLVRDPQTGLYAFRVDLAYCREYLAKWESKKYVTLQPAALTWTPYVMGRGNATNFELGPALTAIAPREEDDDQKAAEQFVASLSNGNGMSANDRRPIDDRGTVASANDGSVAATGEETVLASTFATVLQSTEPNDQDGFTLEARDQHRNGAGAGGHVDANIDEQRNAAAVELASGIESEDHDRKENSGGDANYGELKQPSLLAVNGFAAQPHCDTTSSVPKPVGEHSKTSENDWAAAYDSIPMTRFVVYPPVSARRLNSFTRAPIGRPPGSRTGSGTRGRRRHSTTYVRQGPAAMSAPRSDAPSSSKKKSGGTGRGPGRWPKGTKKSDYGNAESGPGLPPSWLQTRTSMAGSMVPDSGSMPGRQVDVSVKELEESSGRRTDVNAEQSVGSDKEENDKDAEGEDEGRLAVPTPSAGTDDEADAEGEDDDEIMADAEQMQTPTRPSARLAEKRGAHNVAVLEFGSRGRFSPRLGKIRASSGDGDTVMVDAGKM